MTDLSIQNYKVSVIDMTKGKEGKAGVGPKPSVIPTRGGARGSSSSNMAALPGTPEKTEHPSDIERVLNRLDATTRNSRLTSKGTYAVWLHLLNIRDSSRR